MTMESTCPVCKKPYDGVVCTQCTVTDLDMGGLMAGEGLRLKSDEEPGDAHATAYLVDLVSNRKIPITAPRCKVGRDDLNDIVISGDQSISRFHFVITKENGQYMVQDGKSRHGTFLNGNQITVPEPIHDGDVLKVGVSLFWFVIEQVVPANAPEKFAPVDVAAMDQQELEFVLPEPSNPHGTREMNLPDAASVTISPKGEAPKSPNQGEITVAMLLDPLQQQELNKAVAKAAEKQQDESAKVDAKSEKPVESKSSTDDKTDKADSAKTGKDESKLDQADAAAEAKKDAEAKADDEAKHAHEVVAEEPKNFTDFDQAYGEQKTFAEYSYGINDLFDPLRKVANALSAAREEESATENKSEANDLVASGSHSAESTKSSIEAKDSKEPPKDSKESTEEKEEKPSDIAAEIMAETEPELSKAAASSPKPYADGIGDKPSSAASTNAEGSETSSSSPAGKDESQDLKAVEEPQLAASTAAQKQEFEPLQEKAEELEPEMAASTPSTLDKFAEIIGEVSGNTEKKIEEPASSLKLNFQSSSDKVEREESKREDEARVSASTTNGESQTSNGAKGMSIVKEAGSSTVPEWCKKYFSSELNSLSKELTELNEQVRLAQQKIKEVESRVALTKGLRNTLLTSQGEELVEACGKVLAMLGWRVKISEEDKHELRLDTGEDKNVSIARIVWTESQADRTHLGQLSISQTRYWCEQGVEPKGILLVCKSGDTAPAPLSSSDFNSELAEYASKKNVCLMTTLQLLAVYKEIALHDGSTETVRATILASSGWLPGFNLEPGAESADKEESSGTNKLSSLLSA
jgi:pSer/pThr/pTyr-binding forkhead associated (FHA) protein